MPQDQRAAQMGLLAKTVMLEVETRVMLTVNADIEDQLLSIVRLEKYQ